VQSSTAADLVMIQGVISFAQDGVTQDVAESWHVLAKIKATDMTMTRLLGGLFVLVKRCENNIMSSEIL